MEEEKEKILEKMLMRQKQEHEKKKLRRENTKEILKSNEKNKPSIEKKIRQRKFTY